VIFGTNRTSWHGVINCPEGKSRKSIVLDYYTEGRPEQEIYSDSYVIWHNRDTMWKRALYPAMNFAIAQLRPYARLIRCGGSTFDAASKSKSKNI
jgi:hypothetical protein